MGQSTVFVGIDYHQDQIQVCVLDAQGKVLSNSRCGNDWRGIVARVGERRGVHAAIEASTGAADLAEQLQLLAGWQVNLAHARYVARIKQSPDKTDFTDARLLADLTRVGYLPRTWLPPRRIRELRRLMHSRQALAQQRRATKLRIQAIRRDHRLNDAPAQPWTRLWIAWLRNHADLGDCDRWLIEEHLEHLAYLNAKLHRLERKLDEITADDAVVAHLLNIEGIGPVTAWALRASIGSFDRFHSAKALCRYCGLSPRNASSGRRQADAGLINDADPQLRALLIQAAQRLKRTVPRWHALADKLARAGKPKNIATVAVANRWMRTVYHRMQAPLQAHPLPQERRSA